MMDLFSEFFDMFDSLEMLGVQPVMKDNRKCSVCGHTWSDFNRTRKFGCGECYKVFRDSVENVLRQTHQSSQHIGKIPSKSGAEVKAKRRLEELKRQLKDAVSKEDYESAAKIHAEIKAIEGGGIK